MKKLLKNEKGFSLIEMLIVLLIISVLVLLTIPNVTKHSASIDEKGCTAYISMVQSQVEAFKMEKHKYPTTIVELKDEGYFNETPVCPDGRTVQIVNGKVEVSSAE